jgi:Heavy metal binding domain
MKLLRYLIAPPLAAVFFTVAGLYCVPTVTAQKAVTAQKERSAHSKKPAQFHYVCPMHEDVTSKSRGMCHKCKMKLVRKPVAPKSDQ